ncbi:MAG: hypothetical protein IJH70_10360 [Oscillospiraceae bacterium]|nr:hypothetical protein [Oscillospiraceae bacterium]
MNCIYCGGKLDRGDRFCVSCGKPVRVQPKDSDKRIKGANLPREVQRKKNKQKKIWRLMLVCLLVAIIVGISSYLLMKFQNKKYEMQQNTVQEMQGESSRDDTSSSSTDNAETMYDNGQKEVDAIGQTEANSENLYAESVDNTQNSLPLSSDKEILWSKCEGTWFAGTYYGEYGIYEEQLQITLEDAWHVQFKWEKYRVAELSGTADINVETGNSAAFGVYKDSLGCWFAGTIIPGDNSVTFTIEASGDTLLPEGSRFVYTQKKEPESLLANIAGSGPLAQFPEGWYYFKFVDYGSDATPATIDLYEAISFSDEWVSTFETGMSIRIGEGEVVTITNIIPPSSEGKSNVYELSNYCTISKGFDGTWHMYSPSDIIAKRDCGTFQYLFTDDIPFYDARDHGMTLSIAQAFGQDTSTWKQETLRELIARRDGEGGEFHGRTYEARIRNGFITCATIMAGP